MALNKLKGKRSMLIKPKAGFTLVEMLVVVPIVLILVSVLVYALIQMTNSATLSNEKTRRLADVNRVLDIIEQDVSVSNQFLIKPLLRDGAGADRQDFLDYTSSFNPQLTQSVRKGIANEYDSADAPPSSYVKSSRLILNRLATVTNPNKEGAIKQLAHYKRAYGGGGFDDDNCKYNPPVTFNTVYFVSGRNLYRRNIFPRVLQSGVYTYPKEFFCKWQDGTERYHLPWQEPTCRASDLAGNKAYCQKEDQLLLEDAEFTVEYLNEEHDVMDGLNNLTSDDLDVKAQEIQDLLDQVKTIKITVVSKVKINKVATASEIKAHLIVNKISDVPSY